MQQICMLNENVSPGMCLYDVSSHVHECMHRLLYVDVLYARAVAAVTFASL